MSKKVVKMGVLSGAWSDVSRWTELHRQPVLCEPCLLHGDQEDIVMSHGILQEAVNLVSIDGVGNQPGRMDEDAQGGAVACRHGMVGKRRSFAAFYV